MVDLVVVVVVITLNAIRTLLRLVVMSRKSI